LLAQQFARGQGSHCRQVQGDPKVLGSSNHRFKILHTNLNPYWKLFFGRKTPKPTVCTTKMYSRCVIKFDFNLKESRKTLGLAIIYKCLLKTLISRMVQVKILNQTFSE
jgi:hypothetical protein